MIFIISSVNMQLALIIFLFYSIASPVNTGENVCSVPSVPLDVFLLLLETASAGNMHYCISPLEMKKIGFLELKKNLKTQKQIK